jgi:hypothetical protein
MENKIVNFNISGINSRYVRIPRKWWINMGSPETAKLTKVGNTITIEIWEGE